VNSNAPDTQLKKLFIWLAVHLVLQTNVKLDTVPAFCHSHISGSSSFNCI